MLFVVRLLFVRFLFLVSCLSFVGCRLLCVVACCAVCYGFMVSLFVVFLSCVLRVLWSVAVCCLVGCCLSFVVFVVRCVSCVD